MPQSQKRELTFPPRWKPRPEQGYSKDRIRPDGPFIVTVSEVQSYLRCRRAWNYSSANRMSLHRAGTPMPALNVGSNVHYALAQHWRGQNWLQAVNEHFAATKEQANRHYRSVVGVPMSYEEERILTEQRMMCQQLVEAYFARYGHADPIKPYRIVASEITFCVPLVPELDIWLMGTIDRVCVDKDGYALPLEVKTYRSAPKRENWSFNFQTHSYAKALELLIRQRVGMALYDGIRKKGPTEPKILKNGTVSRRWIDTTYDDYIRCVRAAHKGQVPNVYLDILNRLKARDKSPMNAFVHRFRIPLLESAKEQTWDALRVAAAEMAHSPIIIPSKDFMGCPMCRYRDLCDAEYAGEDLSPLIAMNYKNDKTPTRKAEFVATLDNVKNLDQLIAFAADLPHDPLGKLRAENDFETLED